MNPEGASQHTPCATALDAAGATGFPAHRYVLGFQKTF